jgi:DNA-binding IscR family transcriptional regulator
MLREAKAMEYALEVLRALHKNSGDHDSSAISSLVNNAGRISNVSKSYIQKVLPRMVKAGLLQSSKDGYTLITSIDNITVDKVLDICDMPGKDSPIYQLCVEMKDGVSLSGISEFYDFE